MALFTFKKRFEFAIGQNFGLIIGSYLKYDSKNASLNATAEHEFMG